MRVIFLDIDGVLNAEREWKIPYSLNKNCIAAFAELVLRFGARIVLTSSWRKGFDKEKSKQTEQINRLESSLKIYGISIYDKTPELSGKRRAAEVERYLYYHQEITMYAIIDDDKTEFEKQIEGMYIVNYKTGFQKSDIPKVKFVEHK